MVTRMRSGRSAGKASVDGRALALLKESWWCCQTSLVQTAMLNVSASEAARIHAALTVSCRWRWRWRLGPAPVEASASAQQPSAGDRLLTYLWNYQDWLLRPYVTGVTVSGGHTVTVSGKVRLAGATANVRATLHDQPTMTDAARHICRIAAFGVQTLHLRPVISTVQVWSADGRPVARC
jgi:hypothetical protein